MSSIQTRIRHVRKTAFFLAIALCAIVLLSIVYIASPAGEERIRNALETHLAPRLNVNLAIGALKTDVLTHITLRDVEISLSDGTPLASLASGNIGYNLIDILTLRFSLTEVSLDSLTVSLTRDSTGTVILPGSRSGKQPTPDTDGSLFSFGFGRFILTNTAIAYDDRRIPLDITVDGVDASVRSRFTGGYELRITADKADAAHSTGTVSLTDLSANAYYKKGTVTLSRVSALHSDMHMEGSAELDTGQRPVTLNGRYSVTGRVGSISDIIGTYLPERIQPLDGDITLSGTLSVDDSGFGVTMDATGAQITLGPLDFSTLALQGKYQNHVIIIDTLRVTTPNGGIAAATATMHLDSLLTHQASITLNGIRAQRLWRLKNDRISPYKADITATIISSGSLKNVLDTTVAGSINITGISHHDKQYADLTTTGRFTDRMLLLTATQDSSRAECALSIVDNMLSGEFFGEIPDIGIIAGFIHDLDMAGSAVVTGSLGGTFNTPELAASFTGHDIRYRGFPADTISGSLTYQPGTFRLNDTTVHGSVTSIADLTYPPLPDSLESGLSYTGTFAYDDNGFGGDISLDLAKPSYGALTFTTGAAEVSIQDTTISIHDAYLENVPLSLAMAGTYSILGRSLNSHITVHDTIGLAGTAHLGLALGDSIGMIGDVTITDARLASLLQLLPSLPSFGGTVSGAIHFDMTQENMTAHSHVRIDSLTTDRIMFDSITALGSLDNGTALLDSLVIRSSAGRLDAAGSIGLTLTDYGGYAITDTSLIQGWVQSDNLGMPLISGYLRESATAEGTVTANVSWNGTIAEPGLTGNIDLTGGYFLASPGALPIERIETALRLDHSDIIIDRWSATTQNITLDGKGAITVTGIRSYDAVFDMAVNSAPSLHGEGSYDTGSVNGAILFSDLDLAALQGIIPAVTKLGGTVRGSISMNGEPSLSNLQGTLIADGITIKPNVLDESVSNGNITIQFDHEHVYLDTLSCAFGGGTITGNGGLIFDGNSPRDMNLKASGSSITLKKNNLYDIDINSITMDGLIDNTGIVLDGDIVFGESKLTKTVRTRDIIDFTRNKSVQTGSPRPFIDTARLNIRVRDSENIWIDNNMAKLKIHPEIVITGTPRSPIITGRFTADEGYIFYLDRKFDLARCYIDFTDPNRNNPILDIQAETSVRSSSQLSEDPFVITLSISGYAEDPKFTLTSDPALDQADILSVLTFGATRSELAGSSGTILQDRAQMLGSQQISNYLSREARSILGLDDLSIEGNLFNTGKASGPQLLASDSISDRLRITYTTTVGEQNEQSVRLDYQLSRFFSVEGQTNQDGDSGLDLKYRIKF